jgi:hypothetical protein
MGSFSIWHWLIVLIIAVSIFYPYFRIIQKAGYTGWWALLMVVPLVNFIMLWVLALSDWPALRRGPRPD